MDLIDSFMEDLALRYHMWISRYNISVYPCDVLLQYLNDKLNLKQEQMV